LYTIYDKEEEEETFCAQPDATAPASPPSRSFFKIPIS
jgi:hypothetical protein